MLSDIFEGNGIVHAIHGNVVIGADRSDLPGCQLVGMDRQRTEEGLFFNASVLIFIALEAAKANGLNPKAWLNHILTALPERFALAPAATMDDLPPLDADMHRQIWGKRRGLGGEAQ